MKKLILLLPVFLGTMATAQNWSLVMPNDTLVYEKQDNNQFFTIWVDSTDISSTDTTYYMNRISPGEVIAIGPFDLCDSANFIPWYGPVEKLGLYSSQFCGSKVVQSGSKSTIHYGTTEFVVYPNHPVGASWVCDSLTMDSMKVVSIDTAFNELFQTLDSVKIFEFHNSLIYLSKNHGLISGFDLQDATQSLFDNVGVQNLNLGTVIPMGLDFFDFEVGDYFFRGIEYGDSEQFTTILSETKILSKSILGDTITYTARLSNKTTISYSSGGQDIFPVEVTQITLKYWANMDPLLNAFPNTIVQLDTGIITPVLSYRVENNRVLKSNFPDNQNLNTSGICVHDSFLIKYPIVGPQENGIEQVGISWFGYNYDLYMDHTRLVGYKKMDGTSWGYSTPLSTSNLEVEKRYIIYPNPAKNQLNITSEKLNGITVLEIFDLQGQLITTKNFESNLQLNVSEWSNGVYFAVIKDMDGAVLLRKRIVVQ